MNNKQIGTQFERSVCNLLADEGYWVHFIVPDARGAQPFDIIAVRDGFAIAIDCKTCVADVFNISRLEDNQIMAFEKWLRCGNSCPRIAILHQDKIYFLNYIVLKEKLKVNIKNELTEYRKGGPL